MSSADNTSLLLLMIVQSDGIYTLWFKSSRHVLRRFSNNPSTSHHVSCHDYSLVIALSTLNHVYGEFLQTKITYEEYLFHHRLPLAQWWKCQYSHSFSGTMLSIEWSMRWWHQMSHAHYQFPLSQIKRVWAAKNTARRTTVQEKNDYWLNTINPPFLSRRKNATSDI